MVKIKILRRVVLIKIEILKNLELHGFLNFFFLSTRIEIETELENLDK